MGGDAGFDNDVNNDGFDSELKTGIDDQNEVEATVTNSTVDFRQWVRIVNKGPGKLLYGPQNKPKDILIKGQGVTLNHGPDNAVYIIAESGATCDVLIMESG